MPNIFTIMDISRWALQASTRQLDTVSHNVANANTEGYSRQDVVLSTRNPEYTREGWYGHGVQTTTVVRYVDTLLLGQMTDKYTEQEYFSQLLSQLQRLETLTNEAGETSLGEDLTAFFSAWDDVANNSQSSAVRQVLLETAGNLVARFNNLSRDMDQVKRDLNTYLDGGVSEANGICRRIASLNDQIMYSEVGNHTANDLRDERQRQIDRLAEIMNIQWFETANGSVTVMAGLGKTVVQDDYPRPDDQDPLYFGAVAGSNEHQLVWRKADESAFDIVMTSDELSGGEIGAWLKLRDEIIPEMKDFFNGLANTIVKEVNILHSQGVGLSKFTDVTGTYEASNALISFSDENNSLPYGDIVQDGQIEMWVYEAGTRRKVVINVDADDSLTSLRDRINIATGGDPAQNPVAVIEDGNKLRIYAGSGIEFAFAQDTSNVLAALGINTFFDGSTATGISLNEMVATDESYIAAGRIVRGGEDDGEHALGDNSNALDLAALKDAETMNGGTDTFNESIITWASQLGAVVASASDSLTFAETAVAELQNVRDDVSGVNLDEEMVKMIRFQRSYQMAAKLISMADTLLATILELK